MDTAQIPQFRPGRSQTALSTLSQSLSFHASPQSFLSTPNSADNNNNTHPSTVPNLVRAKILNRDVTVISSYQHCRQILHATKDDATPGASLVAARDGGPVPQNTFTVAAAYHELMADFFPAPNLLLLDAAQHQSARLKWEAQMAGMSVQIPSLVRDCVRRHMATWADGGTVDLYEDMKGLVWEILYAVFLGLSPSSGDKYRTFVSLQETLLRGQFSLFPLSIRTPFWRSARSKGLHAREKLVALLRDELASPTSGCPFAHGGGLDDADKANNTLLFTSSIANKALSSLLTASLLNVFLFPHRQPSVAARLRSQNLGQRDALLRSVLRETERLSPPVIGVMRRVENDIRLSENGQMDPAKSVLVPAGWDVWLYFVGASRDRTVYEHANRLIPERYLMHPELGNGFAFGAGEKECLGKETARTVVETVVSVMLNEGWDLRGSIDRPGIRGWLGWDDDVSVEMMARDLKQLPTQRPREPIRVQTVLCA
jgi:cytochrome P450